MGQSFLLFLTASLLSGELFQTVHPEKPGLYHVTVFENGTREFVKIDKSKMLGASDHPDAWDFRKVQGSQTIDNVFDQESCGGCWAFSSADVAGASLYLNTNRTINTILSPQYMIDCHATAKFGSYTYEQAGCNGGYPIVAFKDIQDNGLPTQQCIPWVKRERQTCPTKCTDGSNLNKAAYKGAFSYVDAYKVSLQELRDLVTTSGPCIAEMKAYDDLSSYHATSGVFPVYSHPANSQDYEGHAVTVYGFGVQGTTPYWLIKNSWGSGWGDGGFFKIKMGTNDSGIENNFYSLYHNANDYSTDLVPRPGGTNQEIVDVPECEDKTTSTACISVTGCQWFQYDQDDKFCDWANPKCEEFASEYCDQTYKWGLDCVPGSKYTCAPRDRSVTECAGLTGSDCKSKRECRLYTNKGVETCDLFGAKCSWFTPDQCSSAAVANLELKCRVSEDDTECVSQSTICRNLTRIECIMPGGAASVCHWYDGGSSGVGFCDVNGARCSWFSSEDCVSDSEKYDSMKCESKDDQCSFGTRVAVPAAWALFAMLLLALFV